MLRLRDHAMAQFVKDRIVRHGARAQQPLQRLMQVIAERVQPALGEGKPVELASNSL